MQRSRRFLVPAGLLIVLLIVGAVGTYARYYMSNHCEMNAVEEASALLVGQMKRYDHAYQFAATASQTALIHPVGTLQQIYMDTREVVVPACMQTAKNELINYMDAVIRAFQAFGAGEAEVTIRDLKNQSEMHYDHFIKELEAVHKCAPLCLP